MTGTLILMRHGQSKLNNASMFCGWLDAPLSFKGESQARAAAELIQDAELIPDIIFTSKLTRTCQTAKIIMETLNREWIDVVKTWRLNERHYGALQGRIKSEVLEELGEDEYMHIRRAYDGVPPLVKDNDQSVDDRYKDVLGELPRGESLQMVEQRLTPYLTTHILEQLKLNKTVLIVAHGSSVRAILKVVKSLSEEEIKEVNIPNGIPMVIKLDYKMNCIGTEKYLDPAVAHKMAEEVKNEGFR
jgi:2,3-bisphosphoglycerate-dependent phosphoglycerate mutase